MKLTFLGGARSVTGANYLLETKKTRIIVDCGLEQGGHFCEQENFKSFPYNPKDIDAVLITHSHVDHIGRIPKLVRDGYSKKIYSTHPGKDFAELLLIDSEHLLREEAERCKTQPLYDIKDVEKSISLWEGKKYHEKFSIGDMEIEFFDAGHILGSSFILVSAEGKKIVFSGDLGNIKTPFIKPTEDLPGVDYVLIESAYGDRIHEDLGKTKEFLEDVIEDVVREGGVLMIPSFALERTQEMIFDLNDLVEQGRVSRVPVFIDSPLAIKLTSVYEKYSKDNDYFDKSVIGLVDSGDEIFDFPGLRMSLTPRESMEIEKVPAPKVIIAGSGMSQGGRILFHEKNYLSDPKNTILFVGFQTEGSLGRAILDGVDQVEIHGEKIPVRARVRSIFGYSAHADQKKLLSWLYPARFTLKKVFVVQGEEDQSIPFASKVRDELAVDAKVPSSGETVIL